MCPALMDSNTSLSKVSLYYMISNRKPPESSEGVDIVRCIWIYLISITGKGDAYYNLTTLAA